MRSKRVDPVVIYGKSQTIPGQALKPAELIKRQQAGTLPPIDVSGLFEYHYDESGKQIREPLPLELADLHKYALDVRKKRFETEMEIRKKNALKERDAIIEQFKQSDEYKAMIASGAVPKL